MRTRLHLCEVTYRMERQIVSQSVLPIMHVSRGRKRSFKCKPIQTYAGITMLKPDRQLLVQLVKFAPGKGPQDYVKYYEELDRRLRRRYKKTRHQMDYHEIASFTTYGRFDMVVLWNARDLDTVNLVLAESINPAITKTFGTSETLICGPVCRMP
jgi:hypothetical protein